MTLEFDDESLELIVGLDGIDRVTATGALGGMPEDNRIALRGEWENESTFRLEAHWLGQVVHSTWRFPFTEKGAKVSIDIRPLGRKVSFPARLLPEDG
jgi:hypothetical protein